MAVRNAATDHDDFMERDARRNKIIQKAVDAADRIIMDGSDGSNEETNFFTAEVARKLMERALIPFSTAIQNKDMGM